jgi:hypothetical protein
MQTFHLLINIFVCRMTTTTLWEVGKVSWKDVAMVSKSGVSFLLTNPHLQPMLYKWWYGDVSCSQSDNWSIHLGIVMGVFCTNFQQQLLCTLYISIEWYLRTDSVSILISNLIVQNWHTIIMQVSLSQARSWLTLKKESIHFFTFVFIFAFGLAYQVSSMSCKLLYIMFKAFKNIAT